jgi:hypothetical protein
LKDSLERLEEGLARRRTPISRPVSGRPALLP